MNEKFHFDENREKEKKKKQKRALAQGKREYKKQKIVCKEIWNEEEKKY